MNRSYLFNSLRKSTYLLSRHLDLFQNFGSVYKKIYIPKQKEHFRVDFIADLIFLRWLGVLILFQTEEVKDPSRDP